MDTNTILGLVGTVSICFALIVVFFVGAVTIVKKVRIAYNMSTDKLITAERAQKIEDGQVALNDKLNKINSKAKE